MKLPGPFSQFSLLMSFAFASAPLVMGAITVASGDYALGVVYIALGVLMFAMPEYITRKLPGPKELIVSKIPFLGRKGDSE